DMQRRTLLLTCWAARSGSSSLSDFAIERRTSDKLLRCRVLCLLRLAISSASMLFCLAYSTTASLLGACTSVTARRAGADCLVFKIVLGGGHQYADAPHSLRLLRTRSERQCSCGAAEQGNELAPLQSIELHLLAQPRGSISHR